MLRAVRVVVLAAVAVGLSVFLHVLAGGGRPAAFPLAILAILTAAAVRPLARREIRLPHLLALLAAGQVVLHWAFERSAALGTAPASGVHHHLHHQHLEPVSLPWMLAAHLAATLATALVLRHGESLLWSLWAWLTGRGSLGTPGAGPLVVLVPCGYLPVVQTALVIADIQARAPPPRSAEQTSTSTAARRFAHG